MFADFLIAEYCTDDGGDELCLVPQIGLAPSPLERHLDFAVAQRIGDSLLLGKLCSTEDLLAGGAAGLVPHALLEGGEGHVCKQQKPLVLLDDFLDIHVGPSVLLILVFHPSVIELQADMVGLFGFNGELHLIHALLGDMGSAYEKDLPAICEGESVKGITQFFINHADNYTQGRADKQGNLTHRFDWGTVSHTWTHSGIWQNWLWP